jgi:hypothetical protein
MAKKPKDMPEPITVPDEIPSVEPVATTDAPAPDGPPPGFPEGVDWRDPYLRATWSNPDPTQLPVKPKE